MKLVCKTRFGSHLYGTATPTSDIDIRGIFIPSKRDVLLGRIPKTNKDNGVSTDDYELYSIHHFVKLACEGQTLAFDMLWTPEWQIERGEAGHVWDQLHALRHKFLSKSMNAFIGYARSQAAKYSLKGERLAKLEAFLGVLQHGDKFQPLNSVWNFLNGDAERKNAQGIDEIQIAGKWYGRNTEIQYVRASIEGVIAGYGQRANASVAGIDWKAMSHALRVSLELRELLYTREIQFPLREAELVRDVKLGRVNIGNIQSLLDSLLLEVEDVAAQSNLPEKVDREFWDDWLKKCIEREMK